MSVAAAGGSDDGNGGGDKKGKLNVPESLPPPSFEEDLKEAEEPPPSAVENLHSLKQSFPDISNRRKDVFQSEFMSQHTTYFKLRDREFRARAAIRKPELQRKDIFTTTSSPSKPQHDHDKDDHHHDDDMALDLKKPNK